MKVFFEINSESDIMLARKLMNCYTQEAPTLEPATKTAKEESPAEEPLPVEAPQSVEVPSKDMPKAKRTRKKKEQPTVEDENPKDEPEETASVEESPVTVEEPSEVEAPTKEEIAAAETREEPKSDLPFDDEPEPLPEDLKPAQTCTLEQWREVLKNKLIECGIAADDNGTIVEGPFASRKPFFNDYVHQISAEYGDRIPSKLSDEVRYRFVQKFNRIAWDEDIKGYSISSVPF